MLCVHHYNGLLSPLTSLRLGPRTRRSRARAIRSAGGISLPETSIVLVLREHAGFSIPTGLCQEVVSEHTQAT
jgi:hypothetical protein